MASALVNNVAPVATESFLDLPASAASAYTSYGWLSPRISFSRDFADDDARPPGTAEAADHKKPLPEYKKAPSAEADLGSPGRDPVIDFEFRRLDDPVMMLPADELFSDGKLVPLQLAAIRAMPEAATPVAVSPAVGRSPESGKVRRRTEAVGSDTYSVFSPKAPRCSSRWRELFGLKKTAAAQSGTGGGATNKLEAQSSPSSSPPSSAMAATSSTRSTAARSLKHFLHRNTKSASSIDSSLSLPLLRDSECESVSISARLSLSSSSSSGPDYEDLPRLSLDSDRSGNIISNSFGRNPPRVRLTPKSRSAPDPCHRSFQASDHSATHRLAVAATPAAVGSGRLGRSPLRRPPSGVMGVPARGSSVDSPRMNSSGKVVFQSLERSSSSPSTFNGGPRVKHRGVERSYSANVVRVTPVLNVPVCSLRGSSKSGSVFGFGQLFSSSNKKDAAVGASSSSTGAGRNSSVGSSGRTGKVVTAALASSC